MDSRFRGNDGILLARAAGLPVLPACVVTCLAGRWRRRRPAAIAGAVGALVARAWVSRWKMMGGARVSLAAGFATRTCAAIVPCATCAWLQPRNDVRRDCSAG